MPLRTNLQVALALFTATLSGCWAAHGPSHAWLPFWILLGAVLLSSGMKVALPSGTGSMSATFPFLLLAVIVLSPFQAMLLAGLSVAAQCRTSLSTPFLAIQIAFNIASGMISAALACVTFAGLRHLHLASPPALALSAVVYFLWTTASCAAVIASSKGESALALWRAEFLWYFPFYLVGAALASLANFLAVHFGWGTALLLAPAVYTLYRTYMGQVSQLKERQLHLEETEALHQRTIEGLAMAIEAKDQGTHDHLFRVRNYVQAVGESLVLDKLEMQALQTASFLHDIGKLAVPEHIINKPGKLTPEEFEKMKIHPGVGAEILERVRFSYPVVPIVRSHHEWWNGTGYPDGLKGEDIPVGARILTVVDCFDALVSDRPYRKAMSSQQALAIIRNLAGKQFDPAIVEIFEQCHAAAELRSEMLVNSAFTPLNTDLEVPRGLAPGAGFEAGSQLNLHAPVSLHGSADHAAEPQRGEMSALLAAATQEAQTLYEMSQSMGRLLHSGEIIALIASRLQLLIPHATCALYLKHGDTLDVPLLHGEWASEFNLQPMALGAGISGWVAQSGRPLLNGNVAMEPGCPLASNGTPLLQAALSVPLRDLQNKLFAVLTLYSSESDSFTREHLRLLHTMETKLALTLGRALQLRGETESTELDTLTGLPNARNYLLQLEAALQSCREGGGSLSVIVCDLNAFTEVNHQRGQMAGNRLLASLADGFRLTCAVQDSVARLGGDEFAFILTGVDGRTSVKRLEAMREATASASRRSGQRTEVSASFGAAFFPAEGNTAEELLAVANRRMYLEKQRFHSANTSHSFEPRVAATA